MEQGIGPTTMTRKKTFTTCEKNIFLHETSEESKKVLLPPLYNKLGLMRQFVKALPKDDACLKYF